MRPGPSALTANDTVQPRAARERGVGNGDGSFGPKADHDIGIFSVSIGDLNADGKPDLVAALHSGYPGYGSVFGKTEVASL